MTTLIAIGFIGGLITGISPCILPVLPVIFFSGTQGGRATETEPTRRAPLPRKSGPSARSRKRCGPTS